MPMLPVMYHIYTKNGLILIYKSWLYISNVALFISERFRITHSIINSNNKNKKQKQNKQMQMYYNKTNNTFLVK
jgi:hypothetical protein